MRVPHDCLPNHRARIHGVMRANDGSFPGGLRQEAIDFGVPAHVQFGANAAGKDESEILGFADAGYQQALTLELGVGAEPSLESHFPDSINQNGCLPRAVPVGDVERVVNIFFQIFEARGKPADDSSHDSDHFAWIGASFLKETNVLIQTYVGSDIIVDVIAFETLDEPLVSCIVGSRGHHCLGVANGYDASAVLFGQVDG